MTEGPPHDNLYTRLKPSAHGIGVFAIRDILAGMRLFEGDRGIIVRVPRAVVETLDDAQLRAMYYDFCPTIGDAFIAPADFNALTMSWYMNHSAKPNVSTDGDIRFTAGRAICAGEELTIDYTQFSDHAAAAIASWTSD